MLNCSGPTNADDASPYELWTGEKAFIDHLKIFGTEGFLHVPKIKRNKLNAVAKKGFLVRYCDNRDDYRINAPAKDDVIRSRDVKFTDEYTLSLMAGEPPTEEIEFVDSIVVDEENEHNVHTDAEEVQYNLRDRKRLQQPATYDDFAMRVCEPDSYTAAVNSDNLLAC